MRSGLDPYKSTAVGDKSPCAFDQLPIVQHTSERGSVSIAQTAAAAQYIGSVTGLAPVDDPAAMARLASACIGIQEMYNALFYGSFVPKLVFEKVLCGACCFAPMRALVRWRLRAKHGQWCAVFERWLRTTKAEGAAVAFLGGGATMSYADICLFDCVEGIEDCGYFDAGDRAKYPLLTALCDHVGAVPAIAAYLAKRGSRFVAAA